MVRLPQAVAKVDSARQELLLEQRRLAKLWDAFKKQEDEYRAIERERDDLWTRVQELEKASAGLGDPRQTFARLRALEKENEKLRADVADLGGRLEEYRASFNEEQERLAKLYKVYEDAEAGRLRAEKEAHKLGKERDGLLGKIGSLSRTAQAVATQRGGKGSKRQRLQRQYAGRMGAIRRRAARAPGGKGPIANRTAAQKARARYERAVRQP